MKRSEVRTFIENGVEALNLNIGFGSGLLVSFNQVRNNEYPTVWLESLEVSPEITEQGLPMDTWQINLHIARKDALDSKPDQYELIVDAADEIAQKLIYQYNHAIDGYALATLSGYSRTPFIKDHADCLTGVLLSFILTVPDKTNVC